MITRRAALVTGATFLAVPGARAQERIPVRIGYEVIDGTVASRIEQARRSLVG